MVINICKEFSETPGARYKHEGKFSGEQFREDLLQPKFEEAIKKKENLIIELDGGYGYPTSFLEEAFGGLAREYGSKRVTEILKFVSNDEPSLVEEIKNYIFAVDKSEDAKWKTNMY